ILTAFSAAALAGDFDGKFDLAVAELRDAIRLAEEMKDTALEVEGHLRLGFLLGNMGALAESEEELVRCMELAGHLGSRRDEARVRQGRADDARELVAFAARSLPEEDAYARAVVLVAEALVSAAGGERSAATASFEEALRLLEEQQLPIELSETRLAFARTL